MRAAFAIGGSIFAIVAVCSGQAKADDGPDCFLGGTPVNVCAQARAVQKEYAAKVPFAISSGATLSALTANGPSLMAIAIWQRTRADIDAYLADGNLTMVDFVGRLSDGARGVVCRQHSFSEFIRLGGRVNYLYRSSDGVELAAPVVRDCPTPP